MNYLKGLAFAPLALFAPNTALPILLMLLGVNRHWYKQLFQSISPSILKLLAIFLGWAIVSCFWSPQPDYSALAWGKLLILVLLGLSWLTFCLQQNTDAARLLLKGFAIGCGGVAIFMLADYVSGSGFVRIRGVTSIKTYFAASHVLALCFYPVCFWLYQQTSPLLCILFACATVAALFTVDIDITLGALAIGGLMQSLAYFIPRRAFALLCQSGFALLVGAFPFICAFILTPPVIQNINQKISIFSYIHRLYIWHFLSEKIVTSPLVGYGLDISSVFMLFHPPSYTWTFFEKNGAETIIQHTPFEPLFFHAHNVIIQLWYELGLVGVLLGGLFFLKVFARVHMLPDPQRIMTIGYSTTAITIALASVNFWSSWWICALWISSGMVILVNQYAKKQ